MIFATATPWRWFNRAFILVHRLAVLKNIRGNFSTNLYIKTKIVHKVHLKTIVAAHKNT